MTDEEFTEDAERYKNMLFRLAYSNTGDSSVCDDIVQEVFIRYYFCGKKFKDEESKKFWLIRVTLNRCHSHTRFWWQKRRSELPENQPSPDTGDSDELIALREALNRLSPKYREAVYLHYYEGYSAAQIGSMLKISTSAVTSRLQRAREALKKYLE